MVTAPTFEGRDLELELLDPNSTPLIRLFSHLGGEWEPPPEVHRNQRVDPPPGQSHRFAVLYTADALPGVAVECRILSADADDRFVLDATRAEKYWVARYRFDKPALFMPLDGRNRRKLGLEARQRKVGGYGPYQDVALALFDRFGSVLHGLSWESFHRNQPGRVFALWHQHKSTIALSLVSTAPYVKLIDDPEWKQFLLDHPGIEAIGSAP